MNNRTLNPLPDDQAQLLYELREIVASHDHDIGELARNRLLAVSAQWADSKNEAEQRARRNAWRVALGAGALAAGALGVAGAAIMTSMRPAPPPQILVVERSSGKVEPLVSLSEWQITPQEATIKRLIATYVKARESYSADTAEDNYLDAGAFMDARQRAQWVAYWDTTNPKSPPNTFKKDGKVRVEIGAITILRNVAGVATGARVSFIRSIRRNDVAAGPATAWIATIPFHWVNAPMSERDRRINELGFESTDYILDADLGNVAVPAALAAPVPAAAPVVSLSVASPAKVTP